MKKKKKNIIEKRIKERIIDWADFHYLGLSKKEINDLVERILLEIPPQ